MRIRPGLQYTVCDIEILSHTCKLLLFLWEFTIIKFKAQRELGE